MTLRLVALTDLERFADPVPTLERLCHLARPGTMAVVLRDRAASFRARLELGRALRQVTARAGQALLVADRVDLALELDADGVHLPGDGLLPSHVERLLPGATLSRAHHGAEDLIAAELGRCHVLLVSPAFEERKGRPALESEGLERRLRLLRQRASGARLLALGGIDSTRVQSALDAGADGVAAIAAAHAPAEQRALVQALGIEHLG